MFLIYLIVAVVTAIMYEYLSLLIYMIAAVIGAFLADYFLGPIFKNRKINETLNTLTMLATLLGSVILLTIDNLLPGRRHR